MKSYVLKISILSPRKLFFVELDKVKDTAIQAIKLGKQAVELMYTIAPKTVEEQEEHDDLLTDMDELMLDVSQAASVEEIQDLIFKP